MEPASNTHKLPKVKVEDRTPHQGIADSQAVISRPEGLFQSLKSYSSGFREPLSFGVVHSLMDCQLAVFRAKTKVN